MTVLVRGVGKARLGRPARKVSVATAVAKVPRATKVPRVILVLAVGPVFLVVCVRRVRWDWLAKRVTLVRKLEYLITYFLTLHDYSIA